MQNLPRRTRTRAFYIWLMAPILGFAVFLAVLAPLGRPVAQAATSSNLNFQARLLTSSGSIVPDGNYNIDFKIYNANGTTGSVGTCSGACLWEETRKNSNSQGVQVINGYFSVNLGSVTAFPAINWDQQLWLTMNIGGTSTGASPTWDGEMQNSGNSIALTALPYSFVAGQLAKTSGANRGTLSFNTVANNPAIILPDASGTVCLQNAVACGFLTGTASDYIQNGTSLQTGANFYIQTANVNAAGGVIQAGAGQVEDLFRLQRSDVSRQLSINSNAQIMSTQDAPTNLVLWAAVSGEAQNRYMLMSDGSMNWGGGSAATDTTLYRSAANTLKTDDNFLIQTATNSTSAFQVQNSSSGTILQADTSNSMITLLGNNSGETTSFSTNANSLPLARNNAGSVAVNGYVYVIGGDDGSTYATTVYYAKLNADGSTGAWSTNANALPAARDQLSSAVANGYLYAIAGQNSSVDQATIYYAKLNADGSTGAWSTNANALPQARKKHSSVVANGWMYVLSGEAGGTTSSINYYAKLNTDGSIGAWNTTSALPAARKIFSSVVSNGYVYVLGGQNSGAQSSVYFAKLNLNGTLGSWITASNSLPAARESHSSVIANGYIYVIGGDNGSAVQTTVYYAQVSRVYIGGSLDLIGVSNGALNEPGDGNSGSAGGSISAGNGIFVGNLQVQGLGSFAQGIAVGGNVVVGGSALYRNSANTTTAFQVQDSSSAVVLSVNTTDGYVINNGTQDIDNVIQNPSFEASGSGGGTGWYTPASDQAITNDSANARSGNQILQVTGNSTTHAITTKYFAVKPGDQLYIEGYVKNSGGANGDAGIYAEFSDKDKGNASFSLANTGLPGTSYVQKTISATVPSGKYYVRVAASVKSTSTTGTFYFDDFYMKRINQQAPLLLTAASATAFQVQNASSQTILGIDSTTNKIFTTIPDGASAIGFTLNTPSYTTSGAKLFSLQNNSTEKFYVDKDGNIVNQGNITATGNVNIGSGQQYQVNGTQISSANLSNNSDLAKLSGTGPQTFTGNNKFSGTVLVQNANTAGFQVQNATQSIFTVDTSGDKVILGAASNVTGKIQFQGSGGAGTLTLVGPTTPDTGNYTLTIPTITGNANICTDNSICSGYASSSSLTTGLAGKLNKNTVDTSAASVSAIQGNLYAFTNNSNNIASGILKLDNGNNTGSTLLVTGTTNYGGTDAYIVVNNTNGTPTGSLIDLQANGVSKFNVDSTGNVTAAGNISIASGKQYQVNGVQIASTNLSDGSNLAKLNGNQTFSGNNTFSSASNSFTGDGAGLTNLNASNVASGTLGDGRLSSNVALLNRTGQTFTGDNVFAPTSNSAGTVIRQTSGTATSGNVLDVQTANGSSSFLKITNAAANEGNVTLQSIGATRDLTLASGSGTIIVAAATGTIQHSNSSLTIDINSGSDSTFIITNAQGGAAASLSVEGDVAVGAGRVYKVGATSGTGITCSSNTFLQNANTLGGIVTSGTCTNAVTSISAAGGSIANGASISGNALTLGYADTSNPGLVSNTTQSFNGNKTFTSNLLVSTNSSTAFQVQNTSNIPFMVVDTSTNIVNLGITGATNANATVNIGNSSQGTQNTNIGSSNAGTVAVTGPTTITGRSSGTATTLAVTNGAAGQTGLVVTGASGQTAEIIKVNANGVSASLFAIGNTGSIYFQNSSNSVTAFQIQNTAGSNVLNVDTSTSTVNVGAFNAAKTSFPTTGILDNFNRANTGPPPSANWSQGPFDFTATHGLQVVSNQLKAAQFGSFTRQDNYWNAASFGPDSEVYATIASLNTSNEVGLYLRGSSIGSGTSNGYYLNIDLAPTATWTMQSITSGSSTTLGSTFNQSLSSGDSVGYSVSGSTLTAWYKPSAGSWTALASRTDTTYASAGRIGVGLAGTNTATILDNFGGGTIAGGFSVSTNGSVTSKNVADSTTAFQIQNSSGTNLFNIDTTNTNITIAAGTIFGSTAYSSGSTSTITQASVDTYSTISATATAASLTFTVPSPTLTTAGRILYVTNAGATNSFTLNLGSSSFVLNTGSTATLMWNGSAWTSAGVDGGTLQNGYNNSTGGSTPEVKVDSTRGGLDIQDANSTISGSLFTVRAANASGLGSSILDVQSTGLINLGTTTQTATITVGQSTASNTISVGSVAGNGNTQTINIGTSATAGSTTNVNIGSTIAGTTTINGATSISLANNTTVAAGKLLVLGSNSSDLTCTSGGVYYNTANNRFRGCENGSWVYLDNYADVQHFTASGTWTKPNNVSAVQVILVGAGGGGGGGGARNGGQERNGGGGGGGGSYISQVYSAADLATASATVGSGGGGGAGAASSATAGSNGSAGGATCLSSSSSCGGTIYLQAFGGGGGGGGNQAAAAGGGGGGGGGRGSAGSTGSNASNTGATGGGPAGGAANTAVSGGAGAGGGSSSSATANAGNAGAAAEYGGGGGGGAGGGNAASGAGGSSLFGAGGGGSGGSTNSGNATGSASAGGSSGTITPGGGGAAGTAGCTVGTAGGAGSSVKAGSGGGGGGANGGGGSAGCNGGNGGQAGGGGGGGGSGSTSGGTGGTGGAGEIWVISW